MGINKELTKGQKVLDMIGKNLILVGGNAMYALAIVLFVMPSGLVTGGVTGISIMISKLTGVEVSYFVFAINIALFIWGSVVLGKHFCVTTAASTVLYPGFLYIFQRVFKDVVLIEDDLVLCAAAAGVMIGFAVGVVARTDSSTGGMDIPPLIINKWTGFPVGTMLCIIDATVICAQLPISSVRQALYGILMVVVYSFVINQVMMMGNGKLQIQVISNSTKEVRDAVLTELHRGVTLLSGTRGLSGESCDVVLTVVSSRQLARAKKTILAVDPDAFMIISKVGEVNGNGFSFSKGDKKLDKSDIL
ncbi:MAG: YitT family protein [Clostridiales bacterium]|nr:YitT family protein [Clostridiales bacterium]